MSFKLQNHMRAGRPGPAAPQTLILVLFLLLAGGRQLVAQDDGGHRVTPASLPAGTRIIGIDHIILGVADLDAGIDAMERLTGVRPVRGGVHPQYGTHNALLATGSAQYIEILAPAPGRELVPYLEPLRSFATPTPVAWVVATSDVDGMAHWLDSGGYHMLPPEPGSRMQPDGSLLEWILLSPNPMINPTVPAFIEWDVASEHPARHLPRVGSIISVSLLDPAPTTLYPLIRALELPAMVQEGTAAGISLEIETARGPVRF
ncbi:MAG: VOC family protein [Alkalispirochaeta sp.]